MKKITVLGSTGSIGKNTLEILTHHRDRFEVVALSARSQLDLLVMQCQQFQPQYAVVSDEQDALKLTKQLKDLKIKTQVLVGESSLEEIASLPEVDYVMSAIVGAAGLRPTLAAARSGKTILLANKESLVMTGELMMNLVKQSKATLLPVDSEHNAIFQCLPADYRTGHRPHHVVGITLTASGGPFRELPIADFEKVTPERAIAHPNWSMGPKISVDSATLMNKGFEVIEAFWLFQVPLAELEVIIHPQSIIHSLVSFNDGSTLAQLGNPDMKTPIAYTLSWPKRITTKVKPLNLNEISKLTFEPVDIVRFPCLELAYSALKAGGTATATLNAANEETVAAFLNKKIRFDEIFKVNADVLEKTQLQPASSIDAIIHADQEARRVAREIIGF